MADVDPETLLEWLNMGQGDERDMQLIALEQLCMLLLMSDNVDRCFERFVPPNAFRRDGPPALKALRWKIQFCLKNNFFSPPFHLHSNFRY